MYNLICFPHYTCGGLLADILNNTWSSVGANGGINSVHHSVGKIGDSSSIFDDFTQDDFDKVIEEANNLKLPDNSWIGTHCWTGKIDICKFNHILNVTTTTFKSKMYRWARSYHHYYYPLLKDSLQSKLDQIDSDRENAKNYLIPFLPVHADNVYNIEFSEIVEESVEFIQLINYHQKHILLKKHMNRWKEINAFLYESNLWTDAPAKRLYEAELENNLHKSYIYN